MMRGSVTLKWRVVFNFVGACLAFVVFQTFFVSQESDVVSILDVGLIEKEVKGLEQRLSHELRILEDERITIKRRIDVEMIRLKGLQEQLSSLERELEVKVSSLKTAEKEFDRLKVGQNVAVIPITNFKMVSPSDDDKAISFHRLDEFKCGNRFSTAAFVSPNVLHAKSSPFLRSFKLVDDANKACVVIVSMNDYLHKFNVTNDGGITIVYETGSTCPVTNATGNVFFFLNEFTDSCGSKIPSTNVWFLPNRMDSLFKIYPLKRARLAHVFYSVDLPLDVKELLKDENVTLSNIEDIDIGATSDVATSNFCVFVFKDKRDESFRRMRLLFGCIRQGCVPVFVGGAPPFLPFEDVVPWRKMSLFVATGRLGSLLFDLKSVSPGRLFDFKRNLRDFSWQFLSSDDRIMCAVLSSLFSAVGFAIPALELTDLSQTSIVSSWSDEKLFENVLPFWQPDEYLGRVLPPLDSPAMFDNVTVRDKVPMALPLVPPSSPWDVIPSADCFVTGVSDRAACYVAKDERYEATNSSARALDDANGFLHGLGGDRPAEQFTVIVLTAGGRRVFDLVKLLTTLDRTPYLHSVVVVWNTDDVKAAKETLLEDPTVKLPKMKAARLIIVFPGTNRLTNRFLPFNFIKTDAVLSLDDDTPIRPDELQLLFRVWRENRDTIVGLPARYHTNDGMYRSDLTCEYSLVLTGLAMLHRYYLAMFHHWLPESLLTKVDEMMNCEDLAMNYLVAHLAGRAPIKVTSRWRLDVTLPAQPTTGGSQNARRKRSSDGLSDRLEHYEKRSECLLYLNEVFGYCPLRRSQSRADSVLFKTSVGSNVKKCFLYV